MALELSRVPTCPAYSEAQSYCDRAIARQQETGLEHLDGGKNQHSFNDVEVQSLSSLDMRLRYAIEHLRRRTVASLLPPKIVPSTFARR